MIKIGPQDYIYGIGFPPLDNTGLVLWLAFPTRWPGDLSLLPRVLDAEGLGPLVPHIAGHHPRHGEDQSEARCSVSWPIRGHAVRDELLQCPHGPPDSVWLSLFVMPGNSVISTNGFCHVTYHYVSLLCRYPITSLECWIGLGFAHWHLNNFTWIVGIYSHQVC